MCHVGDVKGKILKSDGIEFPIDKVNKSLEEGQSYKYLGVLEADNVMANEMKGNVMKEYYRRVKKLLETKVNSVNDFKAINTWAVSVVTYSAVFLRGSRVQLQEIDRKKKVANYAKWIPSEKK